MEAMYRHRSALLQLKMECESIFHIHRLLKNAIASLFGCAADVIPKLQSVRCSRFAWLCFGMEPGDFSIGSAFAPALMFRELERDVREFGFAVRCAEAHLLWVPNGQLEMGSGGVNSLN